MSQKPDMHDRGKSDALGALDVRARLAVAPPAIGGDSLIAAQTSGTATITEYVPATNDNYGEISGSLDVKLGYGAQAGTAGYASALSSTFRLPVAPLKAPPPVVVPR